MPMHKRDRKSLYRSGTKIKQDERRYQCRDIGVNNGRKGSFIARMNTGLGRISGPEFLADTFK